MADVIYILEVEGDLPLTATTEHQQSKAPTTHASPSSDCSTIWKCQTSQDTSSRCGTCDQGTPCHVVAALGLLDGRAASRAVLGARTLLDPLQGHRPAP